jgi:hypothetical protein
MPAQIDGGEMVDRATEIAALRQKLAAAEARAQEMGWHNAIEADKNNAFKLFTSWTSAFEQFLAELLL